MGCQNNYIMIKFEKIYPKRTGPNGIHKKNRSQWDKWGQKGRKKCKKNTHGI